MKIAYSFIILIKEWCKISESSLSLSWTKLDRYTDFYCLASLQSAISTATCLTQTIQVNLPSSKL